MTVSLREFGPGDFGWLVQRHGVLYAREYGWDQSFERLVAGIAAAFDPRTDRAWIATIDGEPMGAVMCVRVDETTAKLRTLLVEPKARGHGVGKALVDEVIRHATASGYETLILWTQSHLHAAIRIYESRGFTKTREWPDPAFGKDDLVSQSWSLTLKP